MEDILASIRRILNEDETAPAAAEVPPAGPEEPPNAGGADEDEVLVLDEGMLVTPPPVAVEEPPAVVALDIPVVLPVETQPAPGLLAPERAAAATSSVGALLRSIAQERSSQVHRGGPTIEDLVREEVRPLLKEWLDQHLPPLVERLVRLEIERVTGRA